MMIDAVKGDLETDNHDEDLDQFDKDAKLHGDNSNKSLLDEEAIVATALVIMVAGYDTTGSTLAFACYQLAKNVEIQEKLRDEVINVLDDNDKELGYEDIKKMTYMDQVLAETLRFHTPLGILNRTAGRDYKIPGSEVIVEKDMEVWVNPIAMHFNQKHYRNPMEFDPDHFSPEAKANRHP